MTNLTPPDFSRFSHFPQSAIDQSIPARFEQVAAQYPDRLAVVAGAQSISYRQLDQLANRVAHGILARRGEGPEPVGLLIHQGAGLVAAILGVLKAGRMYVPLDPAHPLPRTDAILGESGAGLVLTDRADLAAAPALLSPGRTLVTVDQLTAASPGNPPGLPLSGDSLAYIYYTSGSTGRPKGVFDSHRNVLHNVMRYTNTLQISREDRLTLLQSPAFSGAVSSLFCALLNGATLFPYDVPREGIGRHLGDWLIQHEITVYHSVPTIFRSFLRGNLRFPSVRIIRLEGDAASRRDVELFRKYFEPGCMLVNGLGATETGLTRQFFLQGDSPLADGIVPVGYPVPDMEALILDETGDDAGAGAVGQVAIRSRYLALGYWHQPELTRKAFLPDPRGSGARIYLTGDRGRLRADGCLEYLGRSDSSLSIRGHRVEPAEVEHALMALEAVQEAVVVGRVDRDGSPRLVAYLVPATAPPAPIPVLRQGLAAALPDYMVPARFVFLDHLPTGENGKVDRGALPSPEEIPVARQTPYDAPRDSVEERLVRVWEDLLSLQPVGVTDNFFDLGGDSLLAASLLLSLEELASRELPPTTIISAPTIRGQADIVRTGLVPTDNVLLPMRSGGTRPPFFCVVEHGGRAHAGIAAWARHVAPDQPFIAVQSAGLSAGTAPLTSIEAMAGASIAEVRTVQPKGPYYLGGRCFGAVVALEMAHQLAAEGENVGLLFFLDVMPVDFPALASPTTRRRFRRHILAGQLRQELALVPQRRMWKRGPYIVREIGRKMWRLGRAWATRWLIRRGHTLPPGLRDVGHVNQQAFALHTPRTWPGHLTLVLRTDHRGLYQSDPSRDWGLLAAGGCDIHYLDGLPSDLSQELQSRRVAEILTEALRAAQARPGP
jgi:amino acid adenylation domain-containing protein